MNFFWQKGDRISSCYMTDNIILHVAQIGKSKGRTIIIGNGHSMSVNLKGFITKVEPAMAIPRYSEKFDENDTVYDFYYTFECKGLDAAAKDLTEYIIMNELGEDIWLFGHSKCGVCFYKAIPYISSHYIRSTIYLVTISTPFKGTIMASPKFKETPKKLNSLLNFVHGILYSGHVIDYDISPNSDFLGTLPTESDVIKGCTHYNLCSTLESTKFWKCKGIQDKFCKFLSWATGIDDGIVCYESQLILLKEAVPREKFVQCDIFCGHTNSLGVGIDYMLEE